MTFEPLARDAVMPPGSHWITTTKGMSGHFAVEVWMNDKEPDLGPFPEPWETGVGRYRTEAEACVEAWHLAHDLDLPYCLSFTPGMPEFDTAARAIAVRGAA